MLEPNTTPEEAFLDDELLEWLDPSAMSKWEVVEGEREMEKVIETLKQRLSSNHPESPRYGIDDNLTDHRQQEEEPAWDQAIWSTCQLIREFKGIFARTPKSPGVTHSIEHKIITEGKLPPPPPMHRRSLPDRELIEEWIGWMLKHGLIERSDSLCAQNILIVKKEGKEPRVCLDPRAINKITAQDPYPMTRMDEIFAGLYGSAVFTGLDAASGFWQIPIAKADRHKAAFRCELGVFQFTVMPFGLNNAPATFTKWMAITFQGLNHFMKMYIDDILIHSKSVADHPKHLRAAFERCREQDVKLRLTKCEFLREELPMLGYIINTKGVKKNMQKVEPILQYGEGRPANQFSPFKNVTQLQSFLGMVNFYKHHHGRFAHELHLLYGLLSKGKNPKKDWSTACEQAFQRIKEILAEDSLLYFPDESRPFEIHTDASKYAIAAVLLQVQDGVLRTIEYYSRSLKSAELNYNVTEKEFLAIISAIERWHYYLHKPFLVVTDHKPLLGIAHTNRPRLKRWMLRITPYKFDIEHRAGEEMKVVDPLSRDPRLFRISFEEEEKSSETEEPVFGEYEALYQPDYPDDKGKYPLEEDSLIYASETVEVYASRMVMEEVQTLRVYEEMSEIISTLRAEVQEEEEKELQSSDPQPSHVHSELTLRITIQDSNIKDEEVKLSM